MLIHLLTVCKNPLWNATRVSTSQSQLIRVSLAHVPCSGIKHVPLQLTRSIHAPTQLSAPTLLRAPTQLRARIISWTNLLSSPLTQSVRSVHCSWSRRAEQQYDWEVDTNVLRDTLIYSFPAEEKFYRMFSWFGIGMFIFMVNIAAMPYVYNALSEMNQKDKKENYYYRMVFNNDIFKHEWAGLCILMGTTILGTCIYYPRRLVNSLTLLKGGHKLRIQTYSFFGTKRIFTVPLEDVSCRKARAVEVKGRKQLALKIKNRFFPYLLNQNLGVFHEPKIFDLAVGVFEWPQKGKFWSGLK